MKKTIVFIIFSVLVGSTLLAQDTLWMEPAPLSNYYYDNWIDTTKKPLVRFLGGSAYVVAKQFVAEDTLQVYGIAAMMTNIEAFHYNYDDSWHSVYPTLQSYLNYLYPKEPNFNRCEESLLLFQYHGHGSTSEMQQLGDSLHVHYLYTPANHYVMSNRPPVAFSDTIPKPVYERYFQTPQTVYDTFFTGYTKSNFYYCNVIDTTVYPTDTLFMAEVFRPGMDVIGFSLLTPCNYIGYVETWAALQQREMDAPLTWAFANGDNISLYIFPILTPEPPVDTTTIPIDTTVTPIDTTVVPTDTTAGIGKVDMVNRYVSVSPNPAGDRATVLSSFGLTAIEAYDPQARKLYSAPAEGLKATLDVSAWPRGTVLLHIHTPAGTAVKKLLLR